MADLNFLSSFSDTETMPVLFVGHGDPMNAIKENDFVKGFRTIAKTLPKPNAVLCISAHWFTEGSFVTAMEKPRTIHDFYGFPEELFAVKYPAKGSPELAKQTRQLLSPAFVGLDNEWGLDHGSWSVLKHFYPDADVPVVQLSIDYTKPAGYHFNLAKQLSSLRNKGVLIIGSGNIIHNLRLVDFKNIDTIGYGYDWAKEAQEKINTLIKEENFLSLINYEKLGTAVNLSIPTPDHYLPMMYILGLKQKHETISLFNDELVAGSLSMTSVSIQ